MVKEQQKARLCMWGRKPIGRVSQRRRRATRGLAVWIGVDAVWTRNGGNIFVSSGAHREKQGGPDAIFRGFAQTENGRVDADDAAQLYCAVVLVGRQHMRNTDSAAQAYAQHRITEGRARLVLLHAGINRRVVDSFVPLCDGESVAQ